MTPGLIGVLVLAVIQILGVLLHKKGYINLSPDSGSEPDPAPNVPEDAIHDVLGVLAQKWPELLKDVLTLPKVKAMIPDQSTRLVSLVDALLKASRPTIAPPK